MTTQNLRLLFWISETDETKMVSGMWQTIQSACLKTLNPNTNMWDHNISLQMYPNAKGYVSIFWWTVKCKGCTIRNKGDEWQALKNFPSRLNINSKKLHPCIHTSRKGIMLCTSNTRKRASFILTSLSSMPSNQQRNKS